MHKPYKIFTFIALLFITIGSSSCFDIFEEYHFNQDGSGTAKFTIDVSQMMAMMESFAASMDSTGDTQESVDQMFNDKDAEKKLNQIPGISMVKNLNDKGAGLLGFSYHFENLEALNNAIIATDGNMDMAAAMGMGDDGAAAESDTENSFARKGNKWTRTFEINSPQDDVEGEEEQYKEMAEMMFSDRYYTIKYFFEDQQVKKVKKNDNATVSADKKSVTVKTSMKDLIKGEANFSSQIKVK